MRRRRRVTDSMLFDPVVPTTPLGDATTYIDDDGRLVTRYPAGYADGTGPTYTALPAKAATDEE